MSKIISVLGHGNVYDVYEKHLRPDNVETYEFKDFTVTYLGDTTKHIIETKNIIQETVTLDTFVDGLVFLTYVETKGGTEEEQNDPNTIKIFTDGACTNNGYKNSKAGIGIVIPKLNIEVSEKLSGEKLTNNIAELTAILRGLKIAKVKKLNSIQIISDSMYAINCVTNWWPKWEKNNWFLGKNKPVKNVEIIKEIVALIKQLNVTFKHIKAHQKDPQIYSDAYYNNIADKLASGPIN